MVPAWATQSPEQILHSLQDKAPAGLSGHATVVQAAADIIANIKISQATSDLELKKFAAELAARILGDAASGIERLTLVFEGMSIDRVRSISVARSQWQTIKDTADPPSALTIDDGERAMGDFHPATTAVAAAASNPNPYADASPELLVLPELSHAPPEVSEQRSQLLKRLELLHKKGVGTQPYLAILNESEENFKKGNVEAGKECLARLDNSLKGQEKELSSRSTVRLRTGVSQLVPFQPPVAVPPPSTSTTATGAQKPDLKKEDPIWSLIGNHSITELKGTETQVAETFAKAVLAKTLGVDCPNDGPFLVERIRIGTRIHELDMKHVDVGSFRLYDRDKIEALVVSKDPRTLRLIADNIRYLERLLGLEEFQKSKR